MILFFCNFWSNKAEKACFCGFVFLFSNGNLKNTFIFNFQLSIFNSSRIREIWMQAVL